VVLHRGRVIYHRKCTLHQEWKSARVQTGPPKHPMTMWVGSSLENYIFACKIGIALTLEYTKRYGKIHTCAKHLLWLCDNRPSHFEKRMSDTAYYSSEGIPECMPEEYHHPSITDAYQMYYMMDKMKFARYKDFCV
jgi:hypothetical protein